MFLPSATSYDWWLLESEWTQITQQLLLVAIIIIITIIILTIIIIIITVMMKMTMMIGEQSQSHSVT